MDPEAELQHFVLVVKAIFLSITLAVLIAFFRNTIFRLIKAPVTFSITHPDEAALFFISAIGGVYLVRRVAIQTGLYLYDIYDERRSRAHITRAPANGTMPWERVTPPQPTYERIDWNELEPQEQLTDQAAALAESELEPQEQLTDQAAALAEGETEKKARKMQDRIAIGLLKMVEFRRRVYSLRKQVPTWTRAVEAAEIDYKSARDHGKELRLSWDEENYDGEAFVKQLLDERPYLETDWSDREKWEFREFP